MKYGKWVLAALSGLIALKAAGLPSDRDVVIDEMTHAGGWIVEKEGDPGDNVLIETFAWGRSVIRLWANSLDFNDSKAMKSTGDAVYDITELSFDVRMDSVDTDLYICLQDFTGQWHESRVNLQPVVDDFQSVVVKTFAGGDDYSYSGGANDGLWHGPMINAGFRLRPGSGFPSGDQSRSVWVDDIRANTIRMAAGGMAMYLSDDELLEMVDVAAACGVKQYRLNLRWSSVEPNLKGGLNNSYLTRHDNAFDLMASYQMVPSVILVTTPQWASSNPTHEYFKYFRPTNWSDWDDFVDLMASRYGDQVYYWECWNEPNIVSEDITGDPQDGGGRPTWYSSDAEYVTLFNRMRNRLDSSGGRFKLMNGGWGLINGWDRVDNFLSLGADSLMDIHNYHSYGWIYHPLGAVYGRSSFIENLNSTYGLTGETWITEFGYTRGSENNGMDTQQQILQADYLDSVYYLHENENAPLIAADRFMIFCFPDKGWATGSGTNDWGLMSGGSNWVPTRAFYHWQSVGGVAETAFELLYYPDSTLAAMANSAYQTLTVRKRSDQLWDDPWLRLTPTAGVNAHLPVYINNLWWFYSNSGLDLTATVEVDYLDVAGSRFKVTSNGTISPSDYVDTQGTYLLKTAVFTISQANFNDSQIAGADFDLTVRAGTAPLPVRSVRVVKSRVAGVAFNHAYLAKYLDFTDESDPSEIGYSEQTSMDGKACRKVSGTKFLHFRSTRANIPTSQRNLDVTVEYYDNGTGAGAENDRIKIWYNSPVSHYTANTELVRGQTGTWKTHTWHLTDAAFDWQTPAYKTDFKIGNNQPGATDIYIRSVTVTAVPD